MKFLEVSLFLQKGAVFLYNSKILIENIKNTAKQKKITLKNMLADCGLNINAINEITDKKGLSCFPLAKIADYLDVSVDYLLGRTDKMEVNK